MMESPEVQPIERREWDFAGHGRFRLTPTLADGTEVAPDAVVQSHVLRTGQQVFKSSMLDGRWEVHRRLDDAKAWCEARLAEDEAR